MPTTTVRLLLFCTMLGLAPSAARAAEQAAPAVPVNAVGYDIELDALPSPHPRPGRITTDDTTTQPLYVRVGVPWNAVEKMTGSYDWAVVDEIVLSHAEAGYRVVVRPHGDNPLYPAVMSSDPATSEPWSAFLRALALRYKDPVDQYVLGLERGSAEAKDAAFLLKLSSVAIQGADPGARIVLGDLDLTEPGGPAWLESLYAEGVAPYLDGIAVAGQGDLPALRALMTVQDPGAALWLAGRGVQGGATAGGAVLRVFLEGMRAEASLTLFDVAFDTEGLPEILPVLERIRAEFPPTLTPLVESGRGIGVVSPMGQPLTVSTLRLFEPDSKKVLIAYDAGPGTTRGEQAVLSIDTGDFAEPILKDIAAGESAPAGAYQKDEAAGITRVAVPLAEYPLVLEYRRLTSPLFGQDETLEVTGKRMPSVEEILAAHQAFQAAQDASLVNMRADARIEYHFRIGGSFNYDVTILSTFFLDPNVGAEFEQKEFFVNGVKWKSDRFPELPIPQPEKVRTLPLDITLDKRYEYRLAGEDTVDGRQCWAVDFDPREPGGTLYKGRVWIDMKNHAKVRISSLQTGLAPPIISNDEKDTYRPLTGPEGVEYWLLSRIDGQQVFSTTGINLVMVREVTLTNPVVNDPGFDTVRRQAYASSHAILRDTPDGPRYLQPTPEGGRVVDQKLNTDNLSLLGGVLYNQSLDYPIPLIGFNYFNRDVRGTGIQTNILFGGVLLVASAGKPRLGGTPFELSANLYGQGFSGTDQPVRDGEEIEREGVDLSTQAFSLAVGLPFADYWKVKASGTLEYQVFSHDKETARRFVIPTDTTVTTFGLEGEFNRNAWLVKASGETGRRGRWECWGFCDDPNFPTADPAALRDAKDFVRFDGSVAKDFFLPLNQKIITSVSGYGGSDLDRFSQYKFGSFSNRLRGFSGSGIRYTSGVKATVQYAFNLGSIVRFNATVEHARVTDRLAQGNDGDGRFTGFGLSGQTILGPNLIIQLDWGIAIGSTVDAYRGDQEFFLTVLRLFG